MEERDRQMGRQQDTLGPVGLHIDLSWLGLCQEHEEEASQHAHGLGGRGEDRQGNRDRDRQRRRRHHELSPEAGLNI